MLVCFEVPDCNTILFVWAVPAKDLRLLRSAVQENACFECMRALIIVILILISVLVSIECIHYLNLVASP